MFSSVTLKKNKTTDPIVLYALWCAFISGAHGANCVFNMPVSPGALPQTLCTTNPHLHSNESSGGRNKRVKGSLVWSLLGGVEAT